MNLDSYQAETLLNQKNTAPSPEGARDLFDQRVQDAKPAIIGLALEYEARRLPNDYATPPVKP